MRPRTPEGAFFSGGDFMLCSISGMVTMDLHKIGSIVMFCAGGLVAAESALLLFGMTHVYRDVEFVAVGIVMRGNDLTGRVKRG